MTFLRVIEVFPPIFSAKDSRKTMDFEGSLQKLIREVQSIGSVADLILVANLKDPSLLKLSSITAASQIKTKTGIESAPTIVARDANRPQLLSEILTAYSLGIQWVMLAWGDRYGPGDGAKNAYDFRNLSQLIAEAKRLGESSGVGPRLLAPITLGAGSKTSVRVLGKERIDAGSSLLLAQPPTTDPEEALDEHKKWVQTAGLEGRVLLNIFPFRDGDDVLDCESRFGWKLPARVHRTAVKGRNALLAEERKVVGRLRDEGFPGVYVSTRGTPSVAKDILG